MYSSTSVEELGPFKKHIFITFKLNYRFNRFEKNGKIWCWEMLGSSMQLKKNKNQRTRKTRHRPAKNQSHQFVFTFYFSTKATRFCNAALLWLNIYSHQCSQPKENKPWQLINEYIGISWQSCIQANRKEEYRSFSSLLHMNLATRKFAKKT